MQAKFYPIAVKNISKETPNCVSVEFEIPENLKQVFSFTQGQHITLKTIVEGEELRRSYSICAAPNEGILKIAIKKVQDGKCSTWANNQLKARDVVELMPPHGRFYTQLQSGNKKRYIAFAAGSGITPVISIIKETLHAESQSSFVLVYNNKNISNIIFKEEIEALKNLYPQRLQVIHILSKERTDVPLNSGRINAEKLQQLTAIINWHLIDECFICGPQEMIFTVQDFLLERGIQKNKIHFELFASTATTSKTKIAEVENLGATSKISVKTNGRFLDFEMPLSSQQSILDMALQQGADLPFACKGGVCCTCKAKLLQGKVNMDVHWGLEDFEVQQGFVLSCQSHPVTDTIVLDFDVM